MALNYGDNYLYNAILYKEFMPFNTSVIDFYPQLVGKHSNSYKDLTM